MKKSELKLFFSKKIDKNYLKKLNVLNFRLNFSLNVCSMIQLLSILSSSIKSLIAFTAHLIAFVES